MGWLFSVKDEEYKIYSRFLNEAVVYCPYMSEKSWCNSMEKYVFGIEVESTDIYGGKLNHEGYNLLQSS